MISNTLEVKHEEDYIKWLDNLNAQIKAFLWRAKGAIHIYIVL